MSKAIYIYIFFHVSHVDFIRKDICNISFFDPVKSMFYFTNIQAFISVIFSIPLRIFGVGGYEITNFYYFLKQQRVNGSNQYF